MKLTKIEILSIIKKGFKKDIQDKITNWEDYISFGFRVLPMKFVSKVSLKHAKAIEYNGSDIISTESILTWKGINASKKDGLVIDFEKWFNWSFKSKSIPQLESQYAEYLVDSENYFEEGGELKYEKEVESEDEFIVHGYYVISNSGAYEIMLNEDGSMAKVRDAFDSENPKVSDWMEIEYIADEDADADDDDNLIPTIDPNGYNIPMSLVMRSNSFKNGGIPAKKGFFKISKDADSARQAKPRGWRIKGTERWTYRKPTPTEINQGYAKFGKVKREVYQENRPERSDINNQGVKMLKKGGLARKDFYKTSKDADSVRQAKPMGWRIKGTERWTYRKPTPAEIEKGYAMFGKVKREVYQENRPERSDMNNQGVKKLEYGGVSIIEPIPIVLEDGGDINKQEIEVLKNQIKDLFKQKNKWHFINENVNGKNVKMKFYVGEKEVDVQIFSVDGKSVSLKSNYASRKETLNLINDFLDNKFENGGGVDPTIEKEKPKQDNTYIAFYKGKKIEVDAPTSYSAQKIASEIFKAKKSYEVTVVLSKKDGENVVQSTSLFEEGGVANKKAINLNKIGSGSPVKVNIGTRLKPKYKFGVVANNWSDRITIWDSQKDEILTISKPINSVDLSLVSDDNYIVHNNEIPKIIYVEEFETILGRKPKYPIDYYKGNKYRKIILKPYYEITK